MKLISRNTPLEALAHLMAQRDAEVSLELGELIGVLDDLDGESFMYHKAALIDGIQEIVTYLEDPNV